MRSQQSGFTLVEIAIVLVIIGLLLGGILKGQELINSAKAKSLANDFRNVPVYVYAYQDKFRAIPGDDAAAATHVSGGTNPGGATKGDGKIDGQWDSTTVTDESALFWQHVRLAGLATGDTTFAAGWEPTNADGGRIGISSTKPVTDASFNGSYFLCSKGIRGKFAKLIDTQLDDGHTNSGSLRVVDVADGTKASIPETGGGTIISDDNVYAVCMSF
jgi:prepilin-type N-terminal cleavage/methylation domain-containing protein